MKKLIFTTLAIFTGFAILQSFDTISHGKKDGTEPGYTGSPGDSLKNCTACHGGHAEMVDPSWITSNIPPSGYVPGATYRIRATNTEFGATRFGFEVSPQALNGTLLGTLVITDTLRTKLVGDDKYITYREAGVEGVDSNWWEFDWIAPAAGTGEVVFYGAFNSNFEGHKDGDKTFLSTLVVQENGTTGLPALQDKIADLNVYPNPADEYTTVSFEAMKSEKNLLLELADLTGRKLNTIELGGHMGSIIKRIETKALPPGIYLLQLDGKTIRKINVIH